VRGSRLAPRRSSRGVLHITLALIFAGALAIGLTAWLYAGPASAHPGNTCDPEPGHGGPSCHVEVTTTTAARPATGLGDATETDASASSTTTSATVPSVGPDQGIEPSDPRPYVDDNNCLSCHGDKSVTDLMQFERPDGSSVSLYVDPND
jgi:hypothetical protein